MRQLLTQPRLETHSWCITVLLGGRTTTQNMHDQLHGYFKNGQRSLVEKHIFSETTRDITKRGDGSSLVGDVFLTYNLFGK